ncbi:1,4-dihydroxy-2-naphthoate polyprenyltransferase [Schaalia sp. Marseille-Q2122]|uniref:1,4-dihydroxy-2-naphthoate polyprenyltransferase n=1 Tax=Schaalia sp. Marseille-Q2122 TaxID=2736604 RepID=UPI001588F78D|nr:1,4-dihydroxy-2-naphthoate polyprenyltransferase [Schaalia sp. Marseille-Q2122]
MATAALWLEGARLRTLPAALAPVIVGTAAAVNLGAWEPVRAALALLVALLLQVGVNFSNDYSDGIRGTDDHRVGPPRLTASGAVSPRVVLAAALACFALAGVAGLALVALSGTWWLILAGVGAVIAAWFYTGGRTPYGYMGVGLSELMVFVFFGLMATAGTTYTQVMPSDEAALPAWVWLLACGMGLLSVALLMVNNIRDIPTDRECGKTTLAVRLGDRASRWVYVACILADFLLLVFALIPPSGVWAALAGVTALSSVSLVRGIFRAQERGHFLALLRNTGLHTLLWGIVAAVALLWVLV